MCKGVHCIALGESFPRSIYYMYVLSKFGFDTAAAAAENGLCKVCPIERCSGQAEPDRMVHGARQAETLGSYFVRVLMALLTLQSSRGRREQRSGSRPRGADVQRPWGRWSTSKRWLRFTSTSKRARRRRHGRRRHAAGLLGPAGGRARVPLLPALAPSYGLMVPGR